jgi:hypothetical protein
MPSGSGGFNAKRFVRTTTQNSKFEGQPGTLPSANAGQTFNTYLAGSGNSKASSARSMRFNQSTTTTGNYYSGQHFLNNPFQNYGSGVKLYNQS